MVSATSNIGSLSFDTFVADYLDDVRYELIDGEVIDLEPTGLHEQVAGLINRKLNVAIDLLNLPWFIPMKCLIQPLGQNSAFRPDIVILDGQALGNEPLWKTEPVITLGKSIKLVVEVVSTNWQNDYARKVEDYEAMGIAEYWIADYLGLGGKRYIGSSKEPVITIYQLIDGIYQGQQFGRTERPISQTFPDLNLTAEQIFATGRSS
ncbi:Uma2 family endonuclease [Nostoc punctiforme FACHB-252]|uniref:Uma2 family endonuclease n=1 Tax=Nostoc punctiforme FACHB-252 TaxID=1357509 RepID=A0ABR8HG44_NOSPU|nr:Uma2 family endonuclease [Nostoc punctiforme]MBD2614294.1 Uma2 family endonuclease [Nostoc punctiforme FACHB-252]